MKSHIECVKCGSILVPQTFMDVRGDRYVDGLECIDCSNRVVTSVMTPSEYREMLIEHNEEEDK